MAAIMYKGRPGPLALVAIPSAAAGLCRRDLSSARTAVVSPDEARRLLAVASSLRTRVLLSLVVAADCAQVVRLKGKHIDRAQRIIRIEQSKGRKDRNVVLSPKTLTCCGNGRGNAHRVEMRERPLKERWRFPS